MDIWQPCRGEIYGCHASFFLTMWLLTFLFSFFAPSSWCQTSLFLMLLLKKGEQWSKHYNLGAESLVRIRLLGTYLKNFSPIPGNLHVGNLHLECFCSELCMNFIPIYWERDILIAHCQDLLSDLGCVV